MSKIFECFKEKVSPSERLFQIVSGLSALVLAASISGMSFLMFTWWYTPWREDHVISWPEFFGVISSGLHISINSIPTYFIGLIGFNSSTNFKFIKDLPYIFYYSSSFFYLIFLTIFFFSIKFVNANRNKKSAKLTKLLSEICIILFIVNIIVCIAAAIYFFNYL